MGGGETVGFLAALLPGVRELRSPLVSGFIWLFVIYLLLTPDLAALMAAPTIRQVAIFLGSRGEILVPVSVVFAGYVIGVFAETLVIIPLKWIGGRLRLLIVANISQAPRFLEKRFRLRVMFWPLSYESKTMIFDAVIRRITDAGATSGSALEFPIDSAEKSLPSSAPQLSQTAPVQYEHYDRVRNEMEFRLALAPPIFLLGLALPVQHYVVAALAGAISAFVLLIQAAEKFLEERRLLANYVHLGYIDIPIVSTVVTELEKINNKPKSEGQSMAIMACALYNRGYFDEGEEIANKAISGNFSNREDGDIQEFISCLEGRCQPLYSLSKGSLDPAFDV